MSVPRFPDDVVRLFWDVDPRAIDLDEHRGYVIERVMSRGSWRAMRWLRETYPARSIAETLTRVAARLAPRDVAYWSLVTGTRLDVGTGGGRPPWLDKA